MASEHLFGVDKIRDAIAPDGLCRSDQGFRRSNLSSCLAQEDLNLRFASQQSAYSIDIIEPFTI